MDRNFVRFVSFVLGLCAAAAAALVLVLALLGMAGCSSGDASSTWPESAEFSTLETGQDRFSVHGTNIAGWRIIVDHQTGIQYLFRQNYGITPLFEADGTMMRVLEAGE